MARWKVYKISGLLKGYNGKDYCYYWDGIIIEAETASEAILIRKDKYRCNVFHTEDFRAIPEEWEVPVQIFYKQLELNL